MGLLIEQGLAERHGQRIILARNLLATLRERDLETAAMRIANETGLVHRPVAEGERFSGVYRRNVVLASGRFAVLDDGVGFSLVPWRRVIEQRLGETVTAIVCGSGAVWELGKQRGQVPTNVRKVPDNNLPGRDPALIRIRPVAPPGSYTAV